MKKFEIGVIIDSFKTDIPSALLSAHEVGAKGIQVYATEGDMSPENLKGAKRQEFMKMLNDNSLEIAALCGDLGGHGFSDADDNAWRIEKSKRIIDLAKELGTDIVTTHIGVVPEDKSHTRYKVLQDACFELARYADLIDAHFAIETGPETAVVLKGFLDSLDSTGVAVNLDPANFVMVTGDDPAKAVYTLKDYIVHTHAKDGIRLLHKSPEIIYGMIEDEIQAGEAFKEVPLGKGDVNFDEYLKALDDIGYDSYLTIEREVGDDPKGDIIKAVRFLQDKTDEIF